MIEKIKELKIGKVFENATFIDDRGQIAEIIREDELKKIYGENAPDIKQCYLVRNPKAGTIRAYHKHDVLWDYFYIVKGSAKFILFEDPDKELEKALDNKDTILPKMDYKVVVLSDKKQQTIIVPPNVYHGWISLEDDTILISAASEVYNHLKPDEKRIHPYTLGKQIWETEAK